MKSLMNIIFIVILCVCLGWVCTEGAEERERGKIYSHTVKLSSLFPSSSSSSCALSSKASTTKSSLHVVHRHGACSPLTNGKASRPDHVEILRRDQARVEFIRSRMSKKSVDRVETSQSTELPATDGITLGSGDYVVTIGIGTPKHDLSLIFDTGSDLTWTQCTPCSCYPQKEPKFNPSSSSSYSSVSCSSPVCASQQGVASRCSASGCIYRITYGDLSASIGNLASEKFTLTTSDVFDGVNFGCGRINGGNFNGIAGLLGLGRGKLSFPSQTAKTYNNVFSYCLPSSPSYTGHLTFGSAGISNSVQYTPISSAAGSNLYGIDIVGITVGDKQLEIPSTVFSSTQGAIIDSGTVISRLPPKAYEALRSAFKEMMSNYTATLPNSLLDTCYDFTGLEKFPIPSIAFSFSGGTVVELDPSGILYGYDISKLCLALAGDSDDTIFGNVQQRTLQVVYDEADGRIGFAPNGCA